MSASFDSSHRRLQEGRRSISGRVGGKVESTPSPGLFDARTGAQCVVRKRSNVSGDLSQTDQDLNPKGDPRTESPVDIGLRGPHRTLKRTTKRIIIVSVTLGRRSNTGVWWVTHPRSYRLRCLEDPTRVRTVDSRGPLRREVPRGEAGTVENHERDGTFMTLGSPFLIEKGNRT